jgi:hypothetical protein
MRHGNTPMPDYVIWFVDRAKGAGSGHDPDGMEVKAKGSLHPFLMGYTEEQALAWLDKCARINPHDNLRMEELPSNRLVKEVAAVLSKPRKTTRKKGEK